jgi:hypothetical protein
MCVSNHTSKIKDSFLPCEASAFFQQVKEGEILVKLEANNPKWDVEVPKTCHIW